MQTKLINKITNEQKERALFIVIVVAFGPVQCFNNYNNL